MRSIALSAIFVLSMGVSVGNAQTFEEVCNQTSPPVLTANGSRLFVNGQPKFLVLASYFDAMRQQPWEIEADFMFLKSKGIDGIRVFPLWADGTGADATLLLTNGTFRDQPYRLNHFKFILDRASRCGFVVDVTINREMDSSPGISVQDITGIASNASCLNGPLGTTGIPEIVCAIRGSLYPHVFIDLQNERDQRQEMRLTDAEVGVLRNGVKTVDPTRLVMTSHGQGAVPESRDLAISASLDVVAYHQWQQADWFLATPSEVRTMRVTARPVYLQEGARARDNKGVDCDGSYPEGNPFVRAVTAAKQSGAAAYTFHTSASHHLDVQDYQTVLGQCPPEIGFLNQFRPIVNQTPWPTLGDYDRDGKTDFAVWRPPVGGWSGLLTAGGSGEIYWGLSGDIPVRADYDGDGMPEFAVYRVENQTPPIGRWYIWYLYSANPHYCQFDLGSSGDIPVPGDYTGDGVADIAVWSPTTGQWRVLPTAPGTCQVGSQMTGTLGQAGDQPVPADYDGDGKIDAAVWHPTDATWHILYSERVLRTGTVFPIWLRREPAGARGLQWGRTRGSCRMGARRLQLAVGLPMLHRNGIQRLIGHPPHARCRHRHPGSGRL